MVDLESASGKTSKRLRALIEEYYSDGAKPPKPFSINFLASVGVPFFWLLDRNDGYLRTRGPRVECVMNCLFN